MTKETKETEKEEKETNYSTISIPKPLVEKIKKRCEGTGFTSVSSYVTYVLRQLISNMEQNIEQKGESASRKPQTASPSREAFSRDDEEKVKERLKALGYIQ